MGIFQTIEGDLGYVAQGFLTGGFAGAGVAAGTAAATGTANTAAAASPGYGGLISGGSAPGAASTPKGWAIVTQNAGGIAVWGGIGLVGALLVKNLLRCA